MQRMKEDQKIHVISERNIYTGRDTPVCMAVFDKANFDSKVHGLQHARMPDRVRSKYN